MVLCTRYVVRPYQVGYLLSRWEDRHVPGTVIPVSTGNSDEHSAGKAQHTVHTKSYIPYMVRYVSGANDDVSYPSIARELASSSSTSSNSSTLLLESRELY